MRMLGSIRKRRRDTTRIITFYHIPITHYQKNVITKFGGRQKLRRVHKNLGGPFKKKINWVVHLAFCLLTVKTKTPPINYSISPTPTLSEPAKERWSERNRGRRPPSFPSTTTGSHIRPEFIQVIFSLLWFGILIYILNLFASWNLLLLQNIPLHHLTNLNRSRQLLSYRIVWSTKTMVALFGVGLGLAQIGPDLATDLPLVGFFSIE